MKLNKDTLGGAMFFAFGAAFLVASRAYSFGTIGHMGPAYFPSVLAFILMALGIVVAAVGWVSGGAPVSTFAVLPFVLVIGATLLFAGVLNGLGLPIAVFVLALVSAYASRRFRLVPAVLLAVALAVVSAIVFIVALGLPLSLIGTWMQ